MALIRRALLISILVLSDRSNGRDFRVHFSRLLGCNKTYNAADSMAGRSAKCRNCGARFTVPGGRTQTAFEETDPFAAMAQLERLGTPDQDKPVARARLPRRDLPPTGEPPASTKPAPRYTTFAPSTRRPAPTSYYDRDTGFGILQMFRAARYVRLLVILPILMCGGFLKNLNKKQEPAEPGISLSPELQRSMSGNSNHGLQRRDLSAPRPAFVPQPQPVVQIQPVPALRQRIDAFAASSWDEQSREQVLSQLAAFQSEADRLQASYSGDSGLPAIALLIDQLKQKAASLTSDQPDASIYQPIVVAQVWQPAPGERATLDVENSFDHYRIAPPKAAPLDLGFTTGGRTGLTWTIPSKASPRIAITLEPRRNSRQQRVWPITRPFMSGTANRQSLVWVDAREANVSFGSLGGVAFTRIESNNPASNGGRHSVRYVGLDGDNWVTLSLISPVEDASSAALLDSAARSFRRAAPGEPENSPIAPARLALRLADDSENAARLLRAAGSDAEAPVLKQLSSTNITAQRAAADVLAQIGTTKSVQPLRAATKSHDRTVAAAARAALKRVDPSDWVATQEALATLNLNAANHVQRQEALDALAGTKPDDRRDEVCQAVMPVLLDNKAFDEERKSAASVLAAWGTSSLVPELLPLLAKEEYQRCPAALTVLGALKDKRAVMPIILTLDRFPREAKAALIQIGPAAEDDVIKLLKENGGQFRRLGSEILDHIGTAKCIDPLIRASKDQRDFAAKEAAQEALTSVRERVRTTQPPAPATRKSEVVHAKSG